MSIQEAITAARDADFDLDQDGSILVINRCEPERAGDDSQLTSLVASFALATTDDGEDFKD